jgi:PAS domain S-box-containing protein
LAKLYKKVDQLETDITERQKAEQALQESEEKFRQFFENAQVYCYMVSPQGIILNANNCVCQALGYDKQELIGQPLSKLYAPESLPMYRQISGQWRLTGVVESEELVVLTKGGQKRYVLLSTGAIRDKNDRIISSVSVQKDITELKQSQAKALKVEALTQLNKAKSELLSNVAHELRTPLQSIKGFIETLIEPDVKWSEKQQLEFLEEADKEVEVLNRLIRDLLDISRIESGKIKLDTQIYRLEEILDSAKARLTILMANHKLEIKIPSGLPAIVVDKMRISQVITNLVENATKFSPKGSVITISAKTCERDFVLAVSDQGVGMAQETMDKLFSRFYQAEQTNGEAKKGTGLGLSICRGIVEAHNGKIWVESSPGNGSVFSFSLPVTEKAG